MAIVVTPLTTAVMNAAGQAHAGAASGINNAVSRTAGLLAVAAFNIIVVSVFSASYLHGLDGLSLPPTTYVALAAQRTSLAGVQIPAGLSAPAYAAVRHTINVSFLAGFQVAMLCATALAVTSAITAALLIEGKAPSGKVA
jgi:hypothetical protein